jgi:group II intron reverse transcriptase/maturase
VKNGKIRNTEYFKLIDIFDALHEQATKQVRFTKLMKYITSDENLLLAYRNIKKNKGSLTASSDKLTIRHIEKLPQQTYLNKMKNKFHNYIPRKVRRVDIPKSNGKKRPLGIPSIWDRLIQQSILQVLEPICEAKFCTRSYGFRPNRSAEHAIADLSRRINIQGMTYVVDVDIQGFFDEVNHCKLMRQLWSMGIQDKQLLVILRRILKAPIEMPCKTVVTPQKGTPQGGVLSPLLANITLNELDWWISNQWETKQTKELRPYIDEPTGLVCYHQVHDVLKKKTTLKPMYIVRYADDFKVVTNTRNNAEKIFIAIKLWLNKRLKLPISEEKSGITNLKKKTSEFLGFTIRAVKKKRKKELSRWVVKTDISPKSLEAEKEKLKKQVKFIQHAQNKYETVSAIGKYNSMVIGIHNYFGIATNANNNLNRLGYEIRTMMYNRFPKESRRNKLNPDGFTSKGAYKGNDTGILKYKKSKSMRYLLKVPIVPVSFIQFKVPKNKKRIINSYTSEGRRYIHKQLKKVSEAQLSWLRSHPITGSRGTLQLNDNRISLYVSQAGKCGVTGKFLYPNEMHCHHKTLWSVTKDDSYSNLIIVSTDIHRLIHATQFETLNSYLKKLKLTDSQLDKVNKLRKMIGQTPIKSQDGFITEQLTLF